MPEQDLIFITNHFPFGRAEAFIEQEIDFLSPAFRRIHILAKNVTDKEMRKVPSNVTVTRVNPKSNVSEIAKACWFLISNISAVAPIIVSEVRQIRQTQTASSFGAFKTMFHDLVKAAVYAEKIDDAIERSVMSNVTVYSYWLNVSALAAIVSKHPTIRRRISRAHGGDVYEYRNPNRYLSFRPTLLKNLDRIFTISEDARRHLMNIVPSSNGDKISISRLGSKAPASFPPTPRQERFFVLSCSYLVPVKRVHLIIEALSTIRDIPISWCHIGDGPLHDELLALAKEKLASSQNIAYEFAGGMTSAALFEYYENNYHHLFINTSSSEGVPVTMMEAQSFGVPVVGPAVGGVPEIIVPGTGHLFSPDSAPVEIATLIRQILSLNDVEYQQMRSQARQNWMSKFDAGQNFSSFAAELKAI